MKEADRRTIAELGLPGVVLMESAAQRLAEFICSRQFNRKSVVIVAGPGNNGGDGLALTRLLGPAGFTVKTWSTVAEGAYRGDAGSNEQFLRNTDTCICRILNETDLEAFERDLAGADLIVDALFGTGLTRPVTGLPAKIIAKVNRAAAPVLAVDIPSGLNADSGAVMGVAVRADWTVSFAFPKRGFFSQSGPDLAGEVLIGAINIPPYLAAGEVVELLSAVAVREMLPIRKRLSHKGSQGRVLLLAGSPGMSGAAILAAESALRGGAGLVYLAAPASVACELTAKTVEVITIALPEKEPGVLDPSAANELLNRVRDSDVIAVGPGLHPGPATASLIMQLLAASPVPLVIDAGGLIALRGNLTALQEAAFPPVLTPHPGEMAALLGTSAKNVQNDRLGIASDCAVQWRAVILLKGYYSIVAGPGGRAAINPTGGPVLATAGSGDLLTGLVAALIAQGLEPENAARAGAYIHGLAGDLLFAGRGHLARDILRAYPAAFERLEIIEAAYRGNPCLLEIKPSSGRKEV